MLRSLRYGLHRLIRRDAAERELTDEVQHLLDMSADDYVRRGMSRADAVRRARMDFGGVESIKEQHRSYGWDAAVDSVTRDVRYAVRGMARNPLFTLVVIATLALGIGATTAMFSVLNAVLLRPLPYADAGKLVLLWTDDVTRSLHTEGTAYLTIADWQRSNQSFDAIGYFSVGRATIGTGATAERSRAALVSGNLFQVLGVAPALGRTIAGGDDRAAVAMISHSLWLRRFHADPDIIGKPLVLDEWQAKGGAEHLTIVGVTPPDFYFPDRGTHIWTPAAADGQWARDSAERFESRARRWTGLGRLRSTVSIDDARADLTRIGDRLARTDPPSIPDFPGYAVSIVPMLDSITGVPLQRALWLLMGAVGLVLLVACTNVANLLLARGAARQQEFALRRALGASRFRLVRQQLIESLALSTLGGIAGLALAVALTRVVTALAAQRLPRLNEATIDTRVVVFAVVAAVVAATVFGLFPALRVTGADRFKIARPRGLMLVAECSIAVVVLVAAGLLLRSLVLVRAVDPGFDPSRVLLARIQFPSERPGANAETPSTDRERALRHEQLQQVLLERVAALPEVETAGFVDDMFISGPGNESIAFPGMDLTRVPAGELHAGSVSPEYFAALRVPLRAGRYLRRDDALTTIRARWAPQQSPAWSLDEKARRAIAEPVVVNETFVTRYLAGKDPIGQRFCIDPTANTYWYEIVGVVRDMHRQGLERAAIPEYFGPYLATPSGRVDLVVRSRTSPLVAMTPVREAIAAVVPAAVIPQTSLAASDLADFNAQRTLQTLLLTSFAALALCLAAIGIYGMVHYAVAQRTREIGVRIAIGARPQDVFTQVMKDGLRLPVIGVALGLAVAIAATRLISHLLYGIDAADPITFAVVSIALLLTAFAATFGPARRASRIDAVVALRAE